jgi:hypothetical protein
MSLDLVREQRVTKFHTIGRLAAEFHILVRRLPFNDPLYPRMFSIFCALARLDIGSAGGSRLRNSDGKFHRRWLLNLIAETLAGERHDRDSELSPPEMVCHIPPVPSRDTFPDIPDSRQFENVWILSKNGSFPGGLILVIVTKQ